MSDHRPQTDSSRDAASRPPRTEAYVRLRLLPVEAVGHLKWWLRLAGEARGMVASRRLSPADLRSAYRLVRAGFLPSSAGLYELDDQIEDFVSDRQRELTWSIDWPFAGLLDDKLAFFFMLRHLGAPTPEVTGVISRAGVVRLGSPASDGSVDWLRDRLRERGRAIVRPIRGGGGESLLSLEWSDGAYLVNGRRAEWPEVEQRLSRLHDHLVTDFVEQAEYARRLFPGTTNTLRVLVMNPPGEAPFIAVAVHRVGTLDSAPADNWSQGGLSLRVDPDTGTLGPGIPRPRSGPVQRFDRHPHTGERLSGVTIPHWSMVSEGLLSLSARIPFLPYVGWDVIVTEDGYSIIEGNKFSDLTFQIHGPVMKDPRTRAFLTRFGIA